MIGAYGHGKYVVGGMNARYKFMFKLLMEDLFNYEWITDDTIFSSSCRFMKIKKIKL